MSDTLFSFWGGPLNGQTKPVPPEVEVWRSCEKDYHCDTAAGFSAALDYIGRCSDAKFPAVVTEYIKFRGEFVEAKLLDHLRPRTISDVLRYLAARPLRCKRCREVQIEPISPRPANR